MSLVQVLQAVFYPGTRSLPVLCVAVARVLIQDGRVIIVTTPAAAVFGRPVDLRDARDKLQLLVDLVGVSGVVERLRSIESEYWAFELVLPN